MNQYKTLIAKSFGDALKEVRKEHDLSQEALALMSGIDRTFISMLERGIRQPALSTVFVLCKTLSISPDKFISKIDENMNKTSLMMN